MTDMNKNSYSIDKQETSHLNKKRVVALFASFAVSLGVAAPKVHSWITHKELVASTTYNTHPTPEGDIQQLKGKVNNLIEDESLDIDLTSVGGIVYEGQTIASEVERAGDSSVTIELLKDRLGSISVKATPTSELESLDK